MPEQMPSVESLQRSRRRWIVAAVASWVVLGLVVSGFCWHLNEESRRLNEEVKSARQGVEQMKREAEQALYASRIQLAQQEWERAVNPKPQKEQKAAPQK